MLPNEIIYQIATLVSPSALVKLSLCSKTMRSFILNGDRIWRVQYFREWSSAFPFEDSDSECNLFPAATWLKSFILRKLAEENLYRDSGAAMQSAFINAENYNFFVNDLVFSTTWKTLDVFVGLEFSEELTDFLPNRMVNYPLRRYAMIGWDSNFVIAFDDSLYVFGKEVQKEVEVSGIKELIPVDSNIFLARKQLDYYLYKINEEITNDLFIKGCRVCKVHGTHGRVISISLNKSLEPSWECWTISNNKQEVIYQGQVLSNEPKEKFKLEHFIADTEFLFISQYKTTNSAKEYNIYVYSFSTGKHRIFKISQVSYDVEIAIFYASKWNNIQANYYLEEKHVALALFSGSSTLESLTLKTINVSNIGSISITQLSRRLLLASSYSHVGEHTPIPNIINFPDITQTQNIRNMLDFIDFLAMAEKEFRTEDTMLDAATGEILWRKNYVFPYQVCRGLSSVCSRFYCTRPRKVMDYMSSEDPEIGEWLHCLFNNK